VKRLSEQRDPKNKAPKNGLPENGLPENGETGDEAAIEAIRQLVEDNQETLRAPEDKVLLLKDIVWRSPARQVIDPTDIISRLAEEADKVARGIEGPPSAAIMHPRRPGTGTSQQQSAGMQFEPRDLSGSGEPNTQNEGQLKADPTPPQPIIKDQAKIKNLPDDEDLTDEMLAAAEDRIRKQVMDQLDEQGKLDAYRNPLISDNELRSIVRDHIDAWLASQNSR
jgi:hypothetical protein